MGCHQQHCTYALHPQNNYLLVIHLSKKSNIYLTFNGQLNNNVIKLFIRLL